MNNDHKMSPDEAKEALSSAAKLESAGWRRAVPDRWFGLGLAILIGCMFAVYALENPYPYIVFPILALVIFMASREKTGAFGRDFPGPKKYLPLKLMFILSFLVVFFGSIYLRRVYDAAWISLLAGLLAGMFIYLLSENQRRTYLAKSDQAGA